ncbi:unnamed protein product [Rotaria sp. Silwood1]|nr:unnamed protein product [Rotaria sp. Silwood1]
MSCTYESKQDWSHTSKTFAQYMHNYVICEVFLRDIEFKSQPAFNVDTFYNVIAQDGADPWVYKHTNGWYYFTKTTGSDIRIWRSHTFTSMDAGECIIVWRPPNSGPACRAI